ncbi:MAG: transketolase [Thermoflavifilum sp.]|nr:transketolase [Thermoflavifilum sp.]
MILSPETRSQQQLSFEEFRQQVLRDYRIACESREASVLGRKEVLTGRAKFGIFGDGKEVPQVALARFFRPGDFRSGYYRDQTLAFATGMATVEQFFAQLYADIDPQHDPFSSGRQMNSHFATPFIDENGHWLDLANRYNSAADLAPTSAQMPRSLGLAFASKLFRHLPSLQEFTHLSHHGDEVCFVTIGDASTSEGLFWETINAAGVLQVPMAVFVWDDGYGISVPRKLQTTKNSISTVLEGFRRSGKSNGWDIYRVKGWDYAEMCEVFEAGIQRVREHHIPALFHVEELTQPLGHSTSGSHERYKTQERLAWEKEWDCNRKMREWILDNHLSTEEELQQLEQEARQAVHQARQAAWEKYMQPIREQVKLVIELGKKVMSHPQARKQVTAQLLRELAAEKAPFHKDVLKTASRIAQIHRHLNYPEVEALNRFCEERRAFYKNAYNTHLYAEGPLSALEVPEVKPIFDENAPQINGYEVLNRYFDDLFSYHPTVFAFGEDVGKIGDVNQAFAGLQQKYGVERIFDTGIREATIIGQGIGMAMRGLRPIAEIQYLDYLIFALQTLSDDVATLHYRTNGKQICPLIVRTRGHRLEGIWHSGSPMQMLLGSLRGMYICVPRNMVKAAGMYNTLLRASEPALVIECLNGYRLKEKMPANIREYTVPMGVPEVMREGTDITIVSYGSILRIAMEAIERLQEDFNISCELIDVQTLLPFDIHHRIVESLKKTNRILFLDEDVPGGASAYMLQEVIEKQGGYRWLDAQPRTLSAQAHRPAYGTDGDYFSKPNAEDIIETVLAIMQE